MKVLMIPTWYSGHGEVMSAGIFHYEQSMALQEYCDTALYFPFDTTLAGGFMRDVENGLLTFRRKQSRLRVFKYMLYVMDFLKIRSRFAPDIIHAHVASEAGRIAVLLGRLFRIPVVITEHNPVELAGLDKARNRKRCAIAYKNSSANVCVSHHSKQSFEAFFPNSNFCVIFNGIVDPSKVMFEKCQYAQEGFVNCCIVAAFYSRDIKGYQYLLPAIKELADEGMKIKLHICGDGTYMEEYVQMAKNLGIEDYCIFYGHCNREKIYSIESQMDFCISASVFESAGVAVQEAMLLGKPLVVTKSGGANSLVTKDTAIVVDKESTSALVDGIHQMVGQLDDFDRDLIREYAYKNFEINQVSQRYMELYTEVLHEYR